MFWSKVQLVLNPGTASATTAESIAVCVICPREKDWNDTRQLHISPGNCVEKKSDGFHKCRVKMLTLTQKRMTQFISHEG